MKVKLNTGISEVDQAKVAAELNKVLANVYVSFVQARNFHWNVVGKQFGDLHVKFKELYEILDGMGDDVAERVRALDNVPVATMAEWVALASIKEVSSTAKVLSAEEMVVVMVSDLEAIVTSMRELCDDAGGEDNTTELECDEATETMLGAQMLDLEKQNYQLLKPYIF